MKITINNIKNKKNHEKITCLTAYSFPIAKILDNICDIILVGDSVSMCIYGHPDTSHATIEMMINHGKAVTKACNKALIVVDMPINTYESSKDQALENAKLLINQTKCDAVKIESTSNLVKTAEYLVKNGINLMGHVGLLPQHIQELGNYRYQGKDAKSSQEIFNIATGLQEAGVFSLVIEAVPAQLATKISQSLTIPTIGIGASRECDGQVLVIDDLLGLNQEFKPKFVKNYENLSLKIELAVKNFNNDVKLKKFPEDKNLLL
jgi:3-methyl-2-oxobutanoate hydroxymethyltransferase